MGQTARFGVSLDMNLLDRFDSLIRKMGYDNRSEAIRDLIRQKLIEEQWQAPSEETFGVVSLMYESDSAAVNGRLGELERGCCQSILSSLHAHIDRRNCLEVVLLKGPGRQVRSIGEKLVSLRGIKYGRLNMGTTEQEAR